MIRSCSAAVWGALVCLALAVLLGLLVWAGSMARLDIAVRDHFRPDDVWGQAQLRADLVVEGLKPRTMFLALLGSGALLSVLRRSWRPLGFVVVLGILAAALTLAVKVAVERVDPHHALSTVGGSYPSGHMVAVVVCCGGVALAGGERTRWWQWATTGALAVLMAWCQLLQAAHWFTDLVGGTLLGTAVVLLGSVLTIRPGAPASPRRRTADSAQRGP